MEKNKSINVKSSTKKKFNIAKTILNLKADDLVNKLMNENKQTSELINLNKEFVVTEKK